MNVIRHYHITPDMEIVRDSGFVQCVDQVIPGSCVIKEFTVTVT